MNINNFSSTNTSFPSLSKLAENKLGVSIVSIKEWIKLDASFAFNELERISGKKEAYLRKIFRKFSVNPDIERKIYETFKFHLGTDFSLDCLFDVQREMKVPLYLIDQTLIRNLAKHIYFFLEANDRKDLNGINVLNYLKKIKAFHFVPEMLLRSLEKSIQEQIDVFLQNPNPLYIASKSNLRDTLEWRIYTLKNASAALSKPETIYRKIYKDNGLKSEIKEKIESKGSQFIANSLFIHLQNLRKIINSEPHPNEFIENLKNIINVLTPFFKYTLSACVNHNVSYHIGIEYILKFTDPKERPFTVLASTLLEKYLKFFEFNTTIYSRTDLWKQSKKMFYHSFILVEDPKTSQKIIIDPVYKYYLPESMNHPSEDILILSSDEKEKWISALQKNGSSAKYPSLNKLWNIKEGYQKVELNSCAELYFSYTIPRELKDVLALEGIFDKVGLKDAFINQDPIGETRQLGYKYAKKASSSGKFSLQTKLEFLSELRRISHGGRKYLHEFMDIDGRLVESMQTITIGYNMAIKDQINPNDTADTTAIVGCSGADLATPLLCFNSTNLYLVDHSPISMKKLMEGIKNNQMNEDEYKVHKFGYGGVKSLVVQNKIELNILFELKELRVDLSKIKILPNPGINGFSITFPWTYHGKKERIYKINFVNADLSKTQNYPSELKTVLSQGIDFYLQKAGELLPKHFESYLPTIASAIKPGGCMLINGMDSVGTKYNPLNFLEKANGEFKQLTEDKVVEAYKKLHAWTFIDLIQDENFDDVSFLKAPYLSDYWVFLDMIQKK